MDGNWTLVDDAKEDADSVYEQNETLELTQRAADLDGRLVLVPKKGDGVTRTLKVDGVVRDRFILITAIPATRRNLGYTTYLG